MKNIAGKYKLRRKGDDELKENEILGFKKEFDRTLITLGLYDLTDQNNKPVLTIKLRDDPDDQAQTGSSKGEEVRTELEEKFSKWFGDHFYDAFAKGED